MLTTEQKELRYQELLQNADKAYTDFLTDWEYLCKNASTDLAAFMQEVKKHSISEILSMKDSVKINGKNLSYYLEESSCQFYDKERFYSHVFLCIHHVANQCVYKRATGVLSDGFHVQYRVDNSQFFPYITLAMIVCLLWHTLSGLSTTLDVTFERISCGQPIMKTIHTLLQCPEFKDIKKLNYFYSIDLTDR